MAARQDQPRVTAQCLPTAWVIIQTDPLRFFLPFGHPLQTITAEPIAAHVSADKCGENAGS
jgi:hypothetical protein